MNSNKKARLIKELKALSTQPDFWVIDAKEWIGDSTSKEDADWYKNIIITSTEENFDEIPIANLYDNYTSSKFKKWLKKNHLNFDWEDAGTIYIYSEDD